MHDCIVTFLGHRVSGQVWVQVKQRRHVDYIKDSPQFKQTPSSTANDDIFSLRSLDEGVGIRYKIFARCCIYIGWGFVSTVDSLETLVNLAVRHYSTVQRRSLLIWPY